MVVGLGTDEGRGLTGQLEATRGEQRLGCRPRDDMEMYSWKAKAGRGVMGNGRSIGWGRWTVEAGRNQSGADLAVIVTLEYCRRPFRSAACYWSQTTATQHQEKSCVLMTAVGMCPHARITPAMPNMCTIYKWLVKKQLNKHEMPCCRPTSRICISRYSTSRIYCHAAPFSCRKGHVTNNRLESNLSTCAVPLCSG